MSRLNLIDLNVAFGSCDLPLMTCLPSVVGATKTGDTSKCIFNGYAMNVEEFYFARSGLSSVVIPRQYGQKHKSIKS